MSKSTAEAVSVERFCIKINGLKGCGFQETHSIEIISLLGTF